MVLEKLYALILDLAGIRIAKIIHEADNGILVGDIGDDL